MFLLWLLLVLAAPVWAVSAQIREGAAVSTLIAVLAPILADLLRRFRVPLVVIEILLGIGVGPHCLDLVHVNKINSALALMGMCFLFFMAGLEIDFFRIRGNSIRTAFRGWLLSLAVAAACCALLHSQGWVKGPLLVTVGLSTTAIGTLMPILKDSGELESDFGTLLLGAGAAGEFGPIIVVSLIAGNQSSEWLSALVLFAFAGLVTLTALLAYRLRPPSLIQWLGAKMHTTSQLPVRLCVFLTTFLAFLAGIWGVDVILGAFGAGAVVGMATRENHSKELLHKLDSLTFGFLIPVFFIYSGVKFDLPALAARDTQLRLLMFLALLLLVRGVPALVLYRQLAWRDRWSLAFYSATGLPLIVAIAELGEQTGRMLPENCVALVGAGMASVLIFPVIGSQLRSAKAAPGEQSPGVTPPG